MTHTFTYDNRPMEPEKHPVMYKYRINRKAWNEVLKPHKDFLAYAETMLNMMPDVSISAARVELHTCGGELTYWRLRDLFAEAERYDKPQYYQMLLSLIVQNRFMGYHTTREDVIKQVDKIVKSMVRIVNRDRLVVAEEYLKAV